MDYYQKHNPHNPPHEIDPFLASPRLGAFSTDLVEVGPGIPQVLVWETLPWLETTTKKWTSKR